MPTDGQKQAADQAVQQILRNFLICANAVAADAGFPAAWCTTAAALAREVLPRFGIRRVRVIGVDVVGFNQAGFAAALAGLTGPDLPPGAFSIGTTGSDEFTPTGWDGHAVAYVPSQGSGPWLVDPTLHQLSRPEHGLRTAPMFTRLSVDFLSGKPLQLPTPDSGMVLVRHNPRLRGFRTAPEADYRFVEPLADETERLMRRPVPRRKATVGVPAQRRGAGDGPLTAPDFTGRSRA